MKGSFMLFTSLTWGFARQCPFLSLPCFKKTLQFLSQSQLCQPFRFGDPLFWVKIQNINCETNVDVGQDQSFTLNFVWPPKKVDFQTEMTEHNYDRLDHDWDRN